MTIISSIPTPSSPIGDASDHLSEVPFVRHLGGSSARICLANDSAPTVLRLEYPCQQRSCFTVTDEKVLCCNYDIPASICLHFLDKSTGMIDGPGDICVYERMFLAEVRLSFPLIVQDLLFSLGIALGQLMPNG